MSPTSTGFSATASLAEALAGGYIGEVPIADALHQAFTGHRLWAGTVFYFGAVDAELADLLGYSPEQIGKSRLD